MTDTEPRITFFPTFSSFFAKKERPPSSRSSTDQSTQPYFWNAAKSLTPNPASEHPHALEAHALTLGGSLNVEKVASNF
jgi:hypothetical protein